MKKIFNIKILLFSLLLIVLFLSIGYSAFNSSLIFDDLIVMVRTEADIRITGIGVESASNAISGGEEYNVSSIKTTFTLSNKTSSITYRLKITNFEAPVMGIYQITGLPDYLDYEFSNYTEKEKICDNNDNCSLGIVKDDILLTIKYKDQTTTPSITNHNIELNFDFREIYTITYTDITNNGYPLEVINGDTLTVDFGSNAPSNITVKVSDIEISDYTYSGGILTISNVTGNVEVIKKDNSSSGSSYLCIRATELHSTSSYEFGNLGKSGTLASGDAFDCDVNGDNVYDSETERFYYISDYYDGSTNSFNSDVAALIYYNNTTKGVPDNTSAAGVDYASDVSLGPVIASENLPTTSQWNNVELYNTSRQLTDFRGNISLSIINESWDLSVFDYSGYSARLLTYQELNNACSVTFYRGYYSFTGCDFLNENTHYVDSNIEVYSHWLESPNVNTLFGLLSYTIIGKDVESFDFGTSSPYYAGVRPVIDVLKTDMEIEISESGGSTEDNLITFSIVDLDYETSSEYQAEEGMTWEEWVNSDYNTIGMYIDGYIYLSPGYKLSDLDGTFYIDKDSVIEENITYGYVEDLIEGEIPLL